MQTKHHQAFTMLELTFVIVIIGILSAVAVPRFAATRDDAVISKARVTVASLRNAIATERQLRVLKGDFTPIVSLDSGDGDQFDHPIFDHFDGNIANSRVLEYPMTSCKDRNTRGCWIRTASSSYTYRFPHNDTNVVFDSNNSRFDCTLANGVTQDDCDLLTR